MFVIFEGIDGSGKTTISNLVAAALRERGLVVEHVREGGAFASGVTQRIRDFCRDARNLALAPRAEFLMYVARDVQLREEVLEPALGRADVVIADRYLYTAEVLARAGRGLDDQVIGPVLTCAADGLWPDVAVLIDVDPSVARGRRKVAKILSTDTRPASRKGLAGSGMQLRLREAYQAVAAREPERWVVIDNSDQVLADVVARLVTLVERALSMGPATAVREARAAGGDGQATAGREPVGVDSPRQALAAFVDWVDRRAVREPALAAYTLAGLAGPEVDDRRLALAEAAPRVIARGLRGLDDQMSWRLRRSLLERAPEEVALSLSDAAGVTPEAWRLREMLSAVAPAEVAQSLHGLDDDAAWTMRAWLYERAPDAVIASLALVRSPRAEELRERWIAERGGLEPAVARYEPARAAAKSVTALDEERAWKIRSAARQAAPIPALLSLKGMSDERTWRWRQRALARAPKPVLATIAGSLDPRAWAIRAAMAPRCREALDSMIGLADPCAWEIREACLDLWPSTTIKSLGPLVGEPRGQEMLAEALSRHADVLSLLKHAAHLVMTGRLARRVLAA
jgi:dTMP kinase